MSTALKETISGFLGLDLALLPYWEILDSYPKDNPRLYLCHYNNKQIGDYVVDPDNRRHWPLLEIRGLIVDIVTGAIVCGGYGHSHVIRLNSPLGENQEAILVDSDVKVYLERYEDNPEEQPKITVGTQAFPKASTALFLGSESVVLRSFKWNGQVFLSTYNRISADNVFWGNRAKFGDAFRKLTSGFELQSMYGDEPFSPFTYMFIMNDSCVRLISSIRENRVFYLGMIKTWQEDKYPAYTSKQILPRHPEFNGEESSPLEMVGFSPATVDRPMRPQRQISIYQANQYMFPDRFAPNVPKDSEFEPLEIVPLYYPELKAPLEQVLFCRPNHPITDEVISGGDFTVLYSQGMDGRTRVYHLEPPSWRFRAAITNNDPNMYHQFVLKMAEFTKASPAALEAENYPMYSHDGKPLNLSIPFDRRLLFWDMFLDSVAPEFKGEVDDYMNKYQRDLSAVANYILNDWRRANQADKDFFNENTRKRFDQLSEMARTQKEPFNSLLGMLHRETGNSMYKMITLVRKLRQQHDRQASAGMAQLTLSPAE